jgi:hypothetical protein
MQGQSKHYSYKTEKSYVGWIRRYIFSMINAIPSKKGRLSHISPQFRYPFAPKWLRHSHRSGITRTQGGKNHDDLYPRPQPWWKSLSQSFGWINYLGEMKLTHHPSSDGRRPGFAHRTDLISPTVTTKINQLLYLLPLDTHPANF